MSTRAQGIEIERKSRRVTIHAIDIVSVQAGTVTLDVRCTKGTYIRTLAEDIGARLGCGASLWPRCAAPAPVA